MNTNNATERKTIADTILNQLGGSRFEVMTGAHTFTFNSGNINPDLMFRLPAGKYRAVRIELINDVYDMAFYNRKFVKTHEVTGVYADQLKPIFEKATGLYTTL